MLERTRKRLIKRYSREFFDRVINDYPLLAAITTPTMPRIKPYREYLKITDENGRQFMVDGWTDETGHFIEIYGSTRQSPAGLRRTIRHEMLHAILKQNGLPSGDSDDLFLVLTIHYNANPWGILTDDPADTQGDVNENEVARKFDAFFARLEDQATECR